MNDETKQKVITLAEQLNRIRREIEAAWKRAAEKDRQRRNVR